MAKGSRDRFDVFSELEDLIENSAEPEKKTSPHTAAKFETQSLEERVLFSASWVDADAADDSAEIPAENPDAEAPTAQESADPFADYDSVVEGTDGNDRLNGGDGNDAMIGGGGNDTLYGNGGNDLIIGGQGNDNLSGNDGNDTFLYDQGDGTDQFTGGDGHDVVDATGADTLNMYYMKQSSSIETIQGGQDGLEIRGTSGNDYLDFTNTELQNVTQIDGGEGRDTLRGSQADDLIIGGLGNDNLSGNGGDDTFIYNQGDGTDQFTGGDGYDVVDATGADTLNMYYMKQSSSIETIQGGQDGLEIRGTSGNDYLDFTNTELQNVTQIDGGEGRDTLRGSQADDLIIGGLGNDNLSGNGGDDTFIYNQGDGTDQFTGGDGYDVVDATGADTLNMYYMKQSSSIETIQGGQDGLEIRGTSGNDYLDFTNTELQNVTQIDGGEGRDTLRGSQADDLIIGGLGNDNLSGNGGDDTFIYNQGDGTDQFTGGDGYDVVDATGADTLNMYYMKQSSSIETIQGGQDGLEIRGTSGNDYLDFTNTELQNVTQIDGGEGRDTLRGSQADDLIIGGLGNDNLSGNGGDDTFIYNQGDGTDQFTGGDGYDVVDATGADTLNMYYMKQSSSIETIQGGQDGLEIRGTSGNDYLDFTNTDLENVTQIDGGEGRDTLRGSQADDLIIGGEGNDNLSGNGGNDTFIYNEGDGTDQFTGGDGHDVVDATGADTLNMSYLRQDSSIETIQGGQDGLEIRGTSGNDYLDFTNTDLENVTQIDGGDGRDTIRGSQGDEVIIGGQGNDNLSGNGGNDAAILLGNWSDYEVTQNSNGTVTITDIRPGSPDGTDVVNGIETLDFADGKATVGDVIEFTPEPLELNGSQVAENSPTGTVVGTFGENDSDHHESTYEIVDADGNVVEDANFEISNNQLVVKSGADLNYESVTSHQLNVRATDSFGRSLTESFTIEVTDVQETIIGTEGRDVLSGTADDDVIMGLGGNDVLQGGEGNDQIHGEGGFDSLYGGSGNDQLYGGEGNDYLYGGDGEDLLDGGDGTDAALFFDSDEGIQVDLSQGTISGGNAEGDTLVSIEGIGGTTHDDILVGDDNANLLFGNSGDDQLSGGDGNDLVIDLAGTNQLSGGDGDDTIYIGGENNSVDAGSGDDTVYAYSGNSDIQTGDGDDTVHGLNSTGEMNVDAGEGNDIVRTGRNNDVIDGGSGDDTLDGGLGDDTVKYSGNWQDYDITSNDDGSFTVSDTRGIDGTDTVKNVESFEFADGIVDAEHLVNLAPNELAISNASVAENSTAGAVVGSLAVDDSNSLDSHTYQIVDADGNPVEDANFEIVGDEVRVKDGADLNFEQSPSHQIDVRVTDSGGQSHTQSFTIDVTDVNEGPTAVGENFNTSEDTPLSGNLLGNDSDVDGDDLLVSEFTQPENGTVVVNNNGDFTYQPEANFSGSDSFTYTVSDGNGSTATETVNIDVAAVADAASLNVNDSVGDEDTAIELDVSTVLSDTDGSESITGVTISGVPSGAELSAGIDNGDSSWTLQASELNGLTITPALNSNDSFDLNVEVTTADGNDTATVSQSLHVEISPVNDAVSDLDLSATLVAENSPAGTVVGSLSATDIDADESFTYAIVDADGNPLEDANFEIVGDEVRVKDGADLNFEQSPSHQIDVRVTDSGGQSHTQSFTIDVTDVNEGPTAVGENFNTSEDTPLSGNLLGNDSDVDGDDLLVSEFTQPENGTVVVNANGDFTYQPEANFSGSDSFTYTVSDGNGSTATETVNIDVAAVADAASLNVNDATGFAPLSLDIQAMLNDIDGSEIIQQVTVDNVPEGVTLSAGSNLGNGQWVLDPTDLPGLSISAINQTRADFELTIGVTTSDGTDVTTVTDKMRVELLPIAPANSTVADTNIRYQADEVEGSRNDRSFIQDAIAPQFMTNAEMHRQFDTSSITESPEFAFAEKTDDHESVWNSAEWKQFRNSVDSADDTQSFSDRNEQPSDTSQPEIAFQIDSETFDSTDPESLIASDAQYYPADELGQVSVDLIDMPELEGLDGPVDSSHVTAGSLLLMFTSKGEKRRQLKNLRSGKQSENEN